MYPKDFFDASELQPKSGTCFLVMPFAKEFDTVSNSIKRVVEGELGIACLRTDELLGGGNIIEDILRGLATSELVIVDVTGRNPNVFYELGIAHMCKPVEKVILLSQEIESIPFDLRPFRHIVYRTSAQGLRVLSTSLREAVGAVGKKVHRIFLDKQHRGALPDRLMGKDRCLYGFEINAGFDGLNAAKVSLVVTRYVMADKLRSTRVFTGGMGLMLGERTPVRGTDWSIALERTSDGEPYFRIFELELSAESTGRVVASKKPSAWRKGKRAKKHIRR